MQPLEEQFNNLINLVGGDAWPYYLGLSAIAVVVLFLAALVGTRYLSRRRRGAERPEPTMIIELERLGEQGPPPEGVQLECYNLPVRLALVVVAPLGRGNELPPTDETAKLLEQIVPGLGRIFGRDSPPVYRWPEQLSFHGFTRSFFMHVPLPGSRGKGTPWCSAAGRVDYQGKSYGVGLVMRAGSTNSLAEHTVEREGGWLDLLRVRSPA